MDDDIMLYIDPITRDLAFDDDGMMREISGAASSAQSVRETLQIWKGEWPLDAEHGTDYDKVFNIPTSEYTPDIVEEIIREAIFQEDTVSFIDDLTVTRSNRTIEISFRATLESGEAIDVEVVGG